jgi:hypothetical protein
MYTRKICVETAAEMDSWVKLHTKDKLPCVGSRRTVYCMVFCYNMYTGAADIHSNILYRHVNCIHIMKMCTEAEFMYVPTISLRFQGIILRVLRLEASVCIS